MRASRRAGPAGDRLLATAFGPDGQCVENGQHPGGVYRLNVAQPGHRHALLLEGADDVLINGNGARLIVTDRTIGVLEINDCQNVIVQDVAEIDYPDHLPFTQGDVLGTGSDARGHYVDLHIADPTMPAPDLADFVRAPTRYAWVVDAPGRLKPGTNTEILLRRTDEPSSSVNRDAVQMLPPPTGVSRIRWWARKAGRCSGCDRR